MYICIYNYEHAFIMAKYELYIPTFIYSKLLDVIIYRNLESQKLKNRSKTVKHSTKLVKYGLKLINVRKLYIVCTYDHK